MNLFAGNRDPAAFDRPNEFLPERWLDGRKGRTDLLDEGGEKLGVPHLTYGAGRRVCPGIDSKFSLPRLDAFHGQVTHPLQWPTAVYTRLLYFCCIFSPGSDSHLEKRRRNTSSPHSVLSVNARSRWTPLPTLQRLLRLRPFRGRQASNFTAAIPRASVTGLRIQNSELIIFMALTKYPDPSHRSTTHPTSIIWA